MRSPADAGVNREGENVRYEGKLSDWRS